ncbi:hypothetical protein KC365_g123 [Hortaea werneckii]|nr:hypothetical protein KC365_g123 [Hortaea werneckii]
MSLFPRRAYEPFSVEALIVQKFPFLPNFADLGVPLFQLFFPHKLLLPQSRLMSSSLLRLLLKLFRSMPISTGLIRARLLGGLGLNDILEMAKSKIVASPFDLEIYVFGSGHIVDSRVKLGSRFFVRRQPVNHSVARVQYGSYVHISQLDMSFWLRLILHDIDTDLVYGPACFSQRGPLTIKATGAVAIFRSMHGPTRLGHFLGGRIFVVSILLAFMDISIVWFIVA